MGKTSTSAALATLLCTACGRLGFEPAPDAAGPADARVFSRFCEEAATRIPADAVGSMCLDFEDAALGPVANATFFVPGRLYARG